MCIRDSIRDARVKLEYLDVAEDIANILTMQKRQAVYDSLVTTLRDRADIVYGPEAPGVADDEDVIQAGEADTTSMLETP